jgi:N-acetylglucosamine-6-phosphate deacetylase
MLALIASRLLTPLESVDQPLVLVEDGRIAEVASRAGRSVPPNANLVDFGDAVLAPGFIDIHIHGSGGHDVMEDDDGAMRAMEQFLPGHGVTSYFPTTVTAPMDTILRALDRIGRAIEAAEKDGKAEGVRARPLGIHLEGPFISHTRRGVHPPAHLLPPTPKLFEKFWQAARGKIRVITIAPELEGAIEVIEMAVGRGVLVSLGHSDADLEGTRRGVKAGARHATHTFNAMRPLGHRDPGILGEVLTDTRVTADIIADGIHLDPAIVDLFLKAKGPGLAVLITDAISATGMPDGRYQLGGLDVEVHDNKCLMNGTLAGSVLTMDRALRNIMEFGGWNLQSALRAATLNPAKAAHVSDRKGEIVAGADADLVVLSPAGEVRKTVVRGKFSA